MEPTSPTLFDRMQADEDAGHPPSPEAIAFQSAQIRAEWSEAETERRLRPDWRAIAYEPQTHSVCMTEDHHSMPE